MLRPTTGAVTGEVFDAGERGSTQEPVANGSFRLACLQFPMAALPHGKGPLLRLAEDKCRFLERFGP